MRALKNHSSYELRNRCPKQAKPQVLSGRKSVKARFCAISVERKLKHSWHGYHFGDRTDGYLRLAPYLCPVQLN